MGNPAFQRQLRAAISLLVRSLPSLNGHGNRNALRKIVEAIGRALLRQLPRERREWIEQGRDLVLPEAVDKALLGDYTVNPAAPVRLDRFPAGFWEVPAEPAEAETTSRDK